MAASHVNARRFLLAGRVVAVLISLTLVASLVVGVPTIPGLPGPRAAQALTTGPIRMCPGVEASGYIAGHDDWNYKLYVPNGATVTVSGSVDLVDDGIVFYLGPLPAWFVGNPLSYGPQPNLSLTPAHSWTNTGASGDIPFVVHADQLLKHMTWRITATVTAGAGGPACAGLTAANSNGHPCAGVHLADVQGNAGDPVNTATGNFHEDYADFSIPARGPGLALGHSYNSLQAGVDSPLGVGWTFSYAMALSFAQPPGGVTLTDEGGATLPFYPAPGGGYEAPAWAVATLVQNGDGSYTLKRCNRTTFGFSSAGLLTSVTDLNGYLTTLQYTAGKLSTVTDSAGRKLTFSWLGTHISSVTDDTGRSVTFGYNDGAGNLTDYTDAGGASWKLTYNPPSSHLLTSIRRPRQAGVQNPLVTTNVYDGSNRVTSQTDELGRPTLIDYTSIPGSTKVTDPKGNVTVEAYQNYVRTALTRGYGTTSASTWTFETDATLGVSKVTDPLGHWTASSYDADGNLVYSRDSLGNLSNGHETFATYNAYDEPLTMTDANGVTTTYTYDDAHAKPWNVVSESTPVGAQTPLVQYIYDTAHPGDVTSVIDPKLKTWLRAYDPATGYVVSETDPLGDKTLYGYDFGRGWLTSTVSPRGQAAGVTPSCTPPALGCTTYAHDAWGHVSTTTDPDGHQTTDHYDVDGNRDYSIDADANRSDFFFDAADQLWKVQRADLTTELTHYWLDGSVKDTVDGAGKLTGYAYDPQGRLSTVTDPDNRVTTYGYDPAGNVVSKADPGGTCPAWTSTWPPTLSTSAKCTATAYDAANRAISVTYSDGTTPGISSLGYDNVGRRTSLTQTLSGPSSSWSWDEIGRLKTATTDGRQVSYAYANTRDPATTVTYPGRGNATRNFDDAGRLTSVQDWLGNLTTFTPDPDSNTTAETSPSGTGLGDTFNPFDNADLLNGVTAKANGVRDASIAYVRDNAGQVSTTTSSGLPDTHSYGYTKLNQVQKVDNVAVYNYDVADNITAMPGVALTGYDSANQLGTASRGSGTTTFGFDPRGNRTSATPSAGPATSYAFDQANRLTSVDTSTFSPQVAAGWYQSVAARSDGTALGWGYNANGQVGDGTTTNRSTPVAVSGLTGVVAVAGAAYESAALKADGTVWTWGWNSVGQLGDGTTTDRSTPVQVIGLNNVTAIAAGASHMLALRADGTVWAWGYNANGQVGDGTTTDRHSPVQVSGLVGVVAIAGGYTHSVALKADGTVWAWGYNGFGQLGNNSTVDSSVPVQVPGLTGVAAVASGYHHVLALKADGSLWAWGYNVAGALGNNTTADSHAPVAVGGGLTGVLAPAAAGYSSWALKSNGAVAAWGNNANGQLGDGTTTNRLLPVTLTGLSGVKGLNPGPSHGLAIASDGSAKAWGYNGLGALGNGTLVDSYSPTAVSSYNRGSAPRASYAYGGDGLRSKKTSAGVVSNFTWDPSSPAALLLDDGANAYLYGPDGRVFEQVGPANALTWYHHDQLGSTRVLTSSAGAVTGTATYDAYGRLTASTGSLGAIGFAGEYTDAETGFVYLRARYYDPGTGQFISRDPLTATTREPYGYVYGNPLNSTDPSGLKTKGLCVGGSIGFVVHFSVQACVVMDNHGGVGVTGSVGAGAGTPTIGVGVSYQTSNAEHVRDLTGPFVSVGGSVGLFAVEDQFGHSCSGRPIVVRNYGVGRSWGPGEAHVDISPTGVLASGGTDPCVPLDPFTPFDPFGSPASKLQEVC